MEKSENEKNSENNEENNKNETDNKLIEQDNKEEIINDNINNDNNDNNETNVDTEVKQMEKQEDKIEPNINEDKSEIKIEKEIDLNNNDKTEVNSEIKKEEAEKEINTDIENIENNNENNNSDNSEKNNDANLQQVTMEIIQAEVNPSSENFNQNSYEFPKDFMDDKIRCNTLTQKLINKTKRNTELKYEEFFTKKRHYLIMTDGGKPVYSRYGDEVENNSIFATLSAMITKFTIFNSSDIFKEELNVISNKKNKIVFMKKGQLIFIAFSKMINDSVFLLHS